MSGLSEVLRSYHVEACGHQGFTMDAGEVVRFTDLQGQQPIDFWAFNREDMSEYMSAAHSRRSVCRLMLRAGRGCRDQQPAPDHDDPRRQFAGPARFRGTLLRPHDVHRLRRTGPQELPGQPAPGAERPGRERGADRPSRGTCSRTSRSIPTSGSKSRRAIPSRATISSCARKWTSTWRFRAAPMDIAGNDTCAGAPTDVLGRSGALGPGDSGRAA